MNKFTKITVLLLLPILLVFYFGEKASACTPQQSGPLGIPTWYKYLPGEEAQAKLGDRNVTVCKVKLYTTTAKQINNNPDKAGNSLAKNVSAIGLAVIEIIMRFLIYLSIGWGIWGGFKILTSGGNSQGFKNGIETIKNAAVGLIIGLLATSLIVFAATKLTS